MPDLHPYREFLKHQWQAKTLHGTHSPFVYQLLEEVIYRKGNYYNYDKVEALRSRMKRDNRIIEVNDLGAGSVKLDKKRKVKDIASISVKNKKIGEMIYRLAVFLQPKTTIELGTSLGITTSYLAMANSGGKVLTFEGDSQTLNIARENFSFLNLANVQSIEGNFDNKLPVLLNELETVDLVFLDGNHRKEPTLRYLKQILPKLKNGSCVIVDDIYWSREMTNAWEEIIKMPEFSVSLDLYYLGILFIRKEQKKEHFKIRF